MSVCLCACRVPPPWNLPFWYPPSSPSPEDFFRYPPQLHPRPSAADMPRSLALFSCSNPRLAFDLSPFPLKFIQDCPLPCLITTIIWVWYLKMLGKPLQIPWLISSLFPRTWQFGWYTPFSDTPLYTIESDLIIKNWDYNWWYALVIGEGQWPKNI